MKIKVKAIDESDSKEFAKKVQTAINSGWEPLGFPYHVVKARGPLGQDDRHCLLMQKIPSVDGTSENIGKNPRKNGSVGRPGRVPFYSLHVKDRVRD